MTPPEVLCIDLADGSTFTAMIHEESGKLHLDTGFLGAFVLNPESVFQVATRLLLLCEIARAKKNETAG